MRNHPSLWILRVLWIVVPFCAVPALDDAFDNSASAVRLTATVLLWVTWAAVGAALTVPHPIGLTTLRLLVPAYTAATVVLAISTQSRWAIAAAAIAAAALVLALSRWIADIAANGAAYGDERRFTLRAPASVLVGPAPVAWAIAAGSATAGPLLVADGRLAVGIPLVVLAIPACWLAARSFHTLSTRWLVVVPAGLTIVDPMTLVDAVLAPRSSIAAFEPALVDTTATDLSLGALGLALELRVNAPLQITRRTGRRVGDLDTVTALLITPADPAGALLAGREKVRSR